MTGTFNDFVYCEKCNCQHTKNNTSCDYLRREPAVSSTLNLKPCPFCGGPAAMVNMAHYGDCVGCGAPYRNQSCAGLHLRVSPEEWNKRALPSEIWFNRALELLEMFDSEWPNICSSTANEIEQYLRERSETFTPSTAPTKQESVSPVIAKGLTQALGALDSYRHDTGAMVAIAAVKEAINALS